MNDTKFEQLLSRFVEAEPNTGCWIWVGGRRKGGYGCVHYPNSDTMASAHTVFYEHAVGPVPKGLELDHKCRNKTCVNPVHLEPVTRQENMWRVPLRDREHRDRCVRGHKYTLVRVCLECKNARKRSAYAVMKGGKP